MLDSNLTDFNRNAMNGVNLCMKPYQSSKTNAVTRLNGATKNGFKSNGFGHHTNGNAIPLIGNSSEDNTWDRNLPVPAISFSKACFITFIVAVICFGSSLTGDFVFDDSEAILNNDDVQLTTPITNLFFNDFWGTQISLNTSHKSFRPLTVLSFRLNHWLNGSVEPHVFHLSNIILHALVSLFVLPVFAIILSSKYPSDNSILQMYNSAPKASLVCTLIFAAHPIHSESVAGVVGRADLLCAIFFMLSFICYVHSYCANKIVCVFMLFLSVSFSAVALLSKEQGITVLGLCIVYDLVVIHHVNVAQVFNKSSTKSYNHLFKFANKGLLIPFIIRTSVLGGSAVLMLVARWYIMGGNTPMFQRVDNPASFMDSLLLRAINYNYIYSINVWLLIHPLWLCFDWSMGCIPLITSMADPRILLVFAFWATAFSVIYSILFIASEKYRKILMMSLSLMLIPFLPASNVFFRVGFVIAERTLYLPSLGFCLLVVIGLCQISKIMSHQKLQIILLIILSSFTLKCIQRCGEWNNEKLLFQSGLKVCPLNAKVHYNIAKTAADSGDKNTAILQYSEAIKLNPDYDQALNNLANILKDNGQLHEAEKLLQNAIYIRPDFAAAWMNLGIVEASLRKHYKAEQSYLIALSHRKRYPDCLYNLGNLYLEMKRYDDAYRVWRNATILKPVQTAAWNNMIIMLDSIGNLQKAVHVAQQALYVLPNEASLHFNLANTLGKLSQYELSESHFIKAIQLKNDNPTYFTNLGVLYHRWKKYNRAEKAYLMALKINPKSKSAIDNLKLLREQLSRHRDQS